MSIQEHLNKIRNAVYGHEVRESIAKGIETAYDDASEKDNANMEVKLARGTNPNLNARLNIMDETDKHNTEKIDSNYNEVTARLAHKVGNGKKAELEDLSTNVLSAIEGGEGTSFDLLSIPQDYSVTPQKTNFAYNASKNLFNNVYHKYTLVGASNNVVQESETGRVVIIKARPNTTYTVWRSEITNRFTVAAFETYPNPGDSSLNRLTNTGATSLTLTTEENDSFLVVYVSNQSEEPNQLQIEIGERATPYEPPFNKTKINLSDDSIPTIRPDMTGFYKISKKNMFDGKYLKNTYISRAGTLDTSDSSLGRTTERMECIPDTYYTVSGGNISRWRFENENGELVGNSTAEVALAPIDARYMYVYYDSTDSEGLPVQIEEGEEATSYEPYYLLDTGKLGIERTEITLPTSDIIITDNVTGNYNGTLEPYESYENNVENLYAQYDQMMSLYPDYISKTLLGNDEVSNLPIYRYDFKPPSPRRSSTTEPPKFLCVTGIHGHEKNMILGAALFFEDLSKNWMTNDVLRMLRWNIHFIVIPALNPYGFNNHQRKNGNGVDLNRNFPNNFNPGDDPESNMYSGTEPLSEVESKIIETLLDENEDILFAIDCHNYNYYPSSAGDLFWFASSNKKLLKVLMGVSNYTSAKLKTNFPEAVEQGNNSVVGVIDTPSTSGRLAHYFTHRNISGMILEAVTGFDGSGTGDTQLITMECLGDLILAAVRNLDKINS